MIIGIENLKEKIKEESDEEWFLQYDEKFLIQLENFIITTFHHQKTIFNQQLPLKKNILYIVLNWQHLNTTFWISIKYPYI